MEVGGKAEQIDLAAVGLGVAAGGVEFAPEGPGLPERIAGQGGVEATDGDRRRLQRRLSLFLKNFKRTPPAASCGVLN